MFSVRVPATSANLGPGFDTLGLALGLFLEIEVEISTGSSEIIYQETGTPVVRVSLGENLIVKAMQRVYSEAGKLLPPLHLRISNEIPVSKGMGSSAAAIVAGLSAANFMLGNKFAIRQLLQWAWQLEGHADNIVPAMVGGLTTAMVYEGQVYYQKVCLPDTIQVVAAVPDFLLPTEKSRAVLPDKVNLSDMVANLQRACYLLASIYNADTRNIHMAMDDAIFQPLRKQQIPGFERVLEMASDAGALGVALSGAGSTIVAFCTNGNEQQIGQAMMEAFASYGMDSRVLYLQPCPEGVKILGKR